MRVPIRAVILALIFGLGLAPPVVAQTAAHRVRAATDQAATSTLHANAAAKRKVEKKKHTAPAAVTLKVSAGYAEQYRDSTWVPVRVTAHNRTTDTISGTIEIPDGSTSGGNQGPPQAYRALYQMPIVLPAGVTKQVTLYLPANSVSGQVTVQVRDADHIYGTATDSPSPFDRNSFSIGVLTSDPATTTWLRSINPQNIYSPTLVRLTPATVDTLPQALANFDLIVIADGSVSRLDRDQLSALDRYVHNGGTVVLIGGPGWQETLRPIPADLIPGSLTGTRTLPDLLGLLSIAKVSPPKHESPATIGVLQNPEGIVLASERGVPLVVQNPLGQGQVLYLAFDPNLDPIPHWSGAGDILTRLFVRAAPLAAGRSTLPQGMPAPSLFFNPFGPSSQIASELDNVPAAALPSILLFLILSILYIVLLGPVNFVVLRRFRRQELMWVTIPLGALLCFGTTFGVAFHLKGNTVLINTVGMVTLDGSTNATRPAALYMGLFAPVRGNYNLTFDNAALPQYVPEFDYYYNGSPPAGGGPLGLRFQEGTQTSIQFLGMNMWSMRNAAIHTTVNVPGTVRSKLHVDRNGWIVGAVHNDTPLTLVHPAIIAGRAMIKLPDMPPEQTIPVRIKPHLNIFSTGDSYEPIWYQLFGQPQYNSPNYGGGACFGCISRGPGIIATGPFVKPCCYGSLSPVEHNLDDRIRNTITQLPDAQNVTALGEVFFIAWNQQPLGTITVDGASPQRRDLNLIVAPLSVNLVPGPFMLRTGTIGAHIVDISPEQISNIGCCGPQGPGTIDVGVGGWATFEFDLPNASHLHFRDLWLHVDAGGADGTDMGRAWDWPAGKWVNVDLSLGYASLHDPDRFISPKGALLIKLVNSGNYNSFGSNTDIRISDTHRSLQISGDGVVQ